jgi:hypothetical protein
MQTLQSAVSSIARAPATPINAPRTADGNVIPPYNPEAYASDHRMSGDKDIEHGSDGFSWGELMTNPGKAFVVRPGQPHVLPFLAPGTTAQGNKDGFPFVDTAIPTGDNGIRVVRTGGMITDPSVKSVISAQQKDAVTELLMQGPAGFAQLIADARRAKSDSEADSEKWARSVASIKAALSDANFRDRDRLRLAYDTFKSIYDAEIKSNRDLTSLVAQLQDAMQEAIRTASSDMAAAAAVGGRRTKSHKRRNVKKRRHGVSIKTQRRR